jgi:mono/diheme cytochrome c family protein/glucose/arabinose dehydrogenase
MCSPQTKRMMFRPACLLYCFITICLGFGAGCTVEERQTDWPPPVRDITEAPVLSPGESLDSLVVPPEFRVELVAAEPLVEDPVAIDIDADGRLWVVEMRGFMTDLVEDVGDYRPTGRVKVLEDQNNDGRMDRQTVFLDSLILPRSLLVLKDGVIVGEPPHLWFARDTDGDLQADEKIAIRDDYGTRRGNPEGMANSPVWGMDNWIHNTRYPLRLRYTDETWQSDSTLRLGDWGLSMDSYGRFYRNWNSDALRVALIDPHYYTRNSDIRTRDAADVRIAGDAQEVWPIRTTRGVNRGYRASVLRENGTLRTVTAAGSPVVYRGDRYPETFQEDVFITEPAGNLVRRFEIAEQGDGTMEAVNAYDRAEFMASTDERFRPVNLYSGPDGTLYVVDMYRGVIEHRSFLTQYLKDHIQERELERPLGRGRIYRVVHESTPPRETRPYLGEVSGQSLVEYLDHPNGWWRDTAQQLIVERGDTSIASTLRAVVRSAGDERTRLHALWTLEGLDVLDPETVHQVLSDGSSHVRAAGVRVSEPWLQNGDEEMLQAITPLAGDPSPRVRLQLAASLGEVPPPAADAALAELLTRASDQPYLAEAAITGLGDREVAFLEYLVRQSEWQDRTEGYAQTLQMLSSIIVDGGRVDEIGVMFQLVGEETDLSRWQRMAVLEGVAEVVPESDAERFRPLRLEARPAGLSAATQVADPKVREKARQIADRIVWPGKEGYEPPEEHRLTPAHKELFERGEVLYEQTCATCHQANGQGREGVSASLVGSRWVVGRERTVVRIILDGKEGTEEVMPAHRDRLSNEDVAAIATYIRNAWGNETSAVAPSLVEDVRKATAVRNSPWTAEELDLMVH